MTFKATDEQVAASWLHDTKEDKHLPLRIVEVVCNSTVASYVDALSDISVPSDGPREVRRAIDRKHIAGAEPEVKTIKLADIISNTRNIRRLDPEFAKIYIPEKRLTWEVLQEGDPMLLKIARRILFDEEEFDDAYCFR